MTRTYSLVTALGIFILTNAAFSAININMKEVGNDVVATASGFAELSNLTGPGSGGVVGWFWGDQPMLTVGPSGSVDYNSYGPISGPSAINTLPAIQSDSGSGDRVGFFYNNDYSVMVLMVPDGYTSGETISGSSTWNNTTLGAMGLSLGDTYEWSWGSAGSGETLTFQVVPEPSSYAAIIGVMAAVFVMARKRR